MAFSRDHFFRHRPYLYHFTDPANEKVLIREQLMLSAAAWVERANEYKLQIENVEDFLTSPRDQPKVLEVGPDSSVTLNDQRPLLSRERFADLRGTYEDFLRFLNSLIFFWPGTEEGPRPKGKLARSFAARYVRFGCLRVPSEALWRLNAPILFCRFNSGAPQKRDRVERGEHIFVRYDDLGVKVEKVAEVVFPNRIALPTSAEWRDGGQSSWRPLFHSQPMSYR